jgi:hypothetical protein
MTSHTQEQKRKAFEAGQRAKNKGLFRTSPFYEDWLADKFFFAGFDGQEYSEVDCNYGE